MRGGTGCSPRRTLVVGWQECDDDDDDDNGERDGHWAPNDDV
jgi:hypothetical protein